MRRLRPMRRMRLARLRRLRWLRRLLLFYWTLPRLLRRDHVPTTFKDISCYGRVLLDPARSAFSAACLSRGAAGVADNVDKRRYAG